jgi:hypothetical protein
LFTSFITLAVALPPPPPPELALVLGKLLYY